MKTKTTYICSECGYKSPKWLGKCPGCNSWNTIQETVITEKKTSATRAMSISNGGSVRMPKKIGDVKVGYETRYKTGLQELDRVLGGGIVQGELILVGGDPGIGKSTLLLQICQKAGEERKILYVSGENLTNEFLTAIEKKTTREFQSKYRNADILLIDDIQFVAGKERTQEEFFYTFNELHCLC